MEKKTKVIKTARVWEKEAQKGISTAKFLLTLQSLAMGRIKASDNERAYQNRLILKSTDLPKETKARLTDLLNDIIWDNLKSEDSDDLVATEKIFITKDQMDRLKFHLETCLDSSINLKVIGFKQIKEAIKTAYEVKMRVVR